jgi:hypothetical protein
MTKKKQRGGGFAFNDADPARMDEATYGELSGLDWEKIDSDKIQIDAIFIDQIEPDFRQPRRTMPTAVRKLWKSANASDMMYLFGAWLKMVEEETEEKFPLERLLDGTGDGETGGDELDTQYFPIYHALLEVTGLATTLKRDRLKNPITVYRYGEGYRIETGERRWLAFQLLEYFYGDGRWERIAAKVGEYDVWGQASENNQRATLNAVAKARQFSLLLMDLYPDVAWKKYEECESDLEFYAQVADGDTWRIPRGKGAQLMNAMGETNPVRLREYRTLLRLDQTNWEKADDGGWKLGAVLNFVRPEKSHTVQIRTVSGNEPSPLPYPQNERGGQPEAAERPFGQYVLPGQERAVAAGLYPVGTPVAPINRGQPISRPVNPPAPAAPPAAPSTPPSVEEADEEDDWDTRNQTITPLFTKEANIQFNDMPKFTVEETRQWIASVLGVKDLRAYAAKARRIITEALDFFDSEIERLNDEYEAQKREAR